MPRLVSKTFSAPLQRMSSRLNWVIVWIPFDVHKTWGKRGHIRVAGEINGFAFRSALFPDGKGHHFLNINKKLQTGAQATTGHVAKFKIAPDLEKRVVQIPPPLARLFKEDRALQRWFETLNFSTRRAIGEHIAEPKSAETRERRAEQFAVRAYETMDAETGLPPMIRMVMGRHPGALAGWERMTPTQRRAQLLSIFYYRDPESRLRRIEKTAVMAAELAAKAKRAAGAGD